MISREVLLRFLVRIESTISIHCNYGLRGVT